MRPPEYGRGKDSLGSSRQSPLPPLVLETGLQRLEVRQQWRVLPKRRPECIPGHRSLPLGTCQPSGDAETRCCFGEAMKTKRFREWRFTAVLPMTRAEEADVPRAVCVGVISGATATNAAWLRALRVDADPTRVKLDQRHARKTPLNSTSLACCEFHTADLQPRVGLEMMTAPSF